MSRSPRTFDEAALAELLRAAPRRHRMPDLPASLPDAVAAGSEVVVALAMEAARTHAGRGDPGAAATAGLANVEHAFTQALAQLIGRALAPEGGDPVYQARVLQAGDPLVQAWADLDASAAADARRVRGIVSGFAHPGKLRDLPDDPRRGALHALYRSARGGDWAGLVSLAESLRASHPRHASDADGLCGDGALRRLVRADLLGASAAVLRYRALSGGRGPRAGSEAASAQGRATASEGERAEHAAAEAMRRVAGLLNRANDAHGAEGCYGVLRHLRTPGELMRGARHAKAEWDVALVKKTGTGAHDVVLLAEAKAAPAAAPEDLPRLLRGLALLANAEADASCVSSCVFASAQGDVRLGARSLQALRPAGGTAPAQVFYLCPSSHEPRAAAVLGPRARALLLLEPASLRFAVRLAAGASPSPSSLAPVWHALLEEERMHATLHQYDIARRARDMVLDPEDVSVAIAARCAA
jgi:hypothetical protein